MKIKADYTNAPAWKEITVKSSLPAELKCLDHSREYARRKTEEVLDKTLGKT